MSDSESAAPTAAAHPHHGGKSIQALERPRYKSWRKKYRKMRHEFDARLEDNKRLFKEEQKLEGIARRLREELDGLLDLCLDMNQSPNIPPELRFNVSTPRLVPRTQPYVRPDVTPETANQIQRDYTAAVHSGEIPALDLHLVREQIDTQLAAQGVETLGQLEESVSHATAATPDELPEELRAQVPLAYLTMDQETEYLLRLDARLSDPFGISDLTEREAAAAAISAEEKPWNELTAREQDRQAELLNPLSQHNWLKQHQRLHGAAGAEMADETESLASHADRPERGEAASTPKAASTRKPRASKNLAKQVGDRAVERAREGWSPGNVSGFDDDDVLMEDAPGSTKRAKDADGTYRAKGGRGGTGKGKRKRSADGAAAAGVTDSASSKKPRVGGGME